MSLQRGCRTTVNVGCCRVGGPGLDKTEVETRVPLGWADFKVSESQDWGILKIIRPGEPWVVPKQGLPWGGL